MGTVAGFFTGIPLDWIILTGIIVVVALDSLRSGIGRATSLSVALTLALVVFGLASQAILLSSVSAIFASPFSQAITFGVLAALLYFLVRRMGLDYIDGGMGEPIQALLAGGAVAAVLVVVWLQIPAFDAVWHLSDRVTQIFSAGFRLWWLLGAFAALAFARG